jgi:hypothetical protein
MWCIGALTEEYRHRMYALLELYARPLSPAEPVICIDEKSLQLIAHSRDPLPMVAHSATKQDYEYVRNGTTNLFVAVEPKAGQRIVEVTAQRGKIDFVAFVKALAPGAVSLHAQARELAEHGGNRNRHPQSAVSGSTHRQPTVAAVRGGRLAGRSKRRGANHRMEVHSSGRRSKAWSTLCFDTSVLTY